MEYTRRDMLRIGGLGGLAFGLALLGKIAPAIAADFGFGVKAIKSVVPDGKYKVVSYTPPDGVYKRFVYVLDKEDGPEGEIYMPYYVEKRFMSLDNVVEEIKQRAGSVDPSERIKVEAIDMKGKVVGFMVYTEGTRPQLWKSEDWPGLWKDQNFYRVMLKEQNFQAGGAGPGGGATGGATGAGGGGFGGSGACLLNGSLVLVNNSDAKKVEDLEIGDEVISFDLKSNKTENTKITKVIKNHPREYFYCINGNLFITNDHPVLVLRDGSYKWCRVENLLIEDRIKSLSGFTEVKAIIKVLKPAVTVYIETELGNYIVKGENDFYVVNANYKDKKLEEDALEIEASALS